MANLIGHAIKYSLEVGEVIIYTQKPKMALWSFRRRILVLVSLKIYQPDF